MKIGILSLVGAVPLLPVCAVMRFEAVVKMSKSSYGVCLCLCYNASVCFLVSFVSVLCVSGLCYIAPVGPLLRGLRSVCIGILGVPVRFCYFVSCGPPCAL